MPESKGELHEQRSTWSPPHRHPALQAIRRAVLQRVGVRFGLRLRVLAAVRFGFSRVSAAMASSADVRNALKLRFPAGSHALMFEVAPATGGGTRYADAVAVGLWASHGHLVQGIEIKVSRSDFLHEMKQPEKSAPVMRYCGRWWLACPKGMVKPEELPPTWGMLELHNGILTPKVKAPILKAEPITLAFFASLCRRRAGLDEEMTAAEVCRQVTSLVESHRKRLDGEHASRLGYQQQKIVDAEKSLEAIKEKTGIDLRDYGAGDDIIAAITMYRKVQSKGGWQAKFSRMRAALEDAALAFSEAGIPSEDDA
jgi:hypothetical protein